MPTPRHAVDRGSPYGDASARASRAARRKCASILARYGRIVPDVKPDLWALLAVAVDLPETTNTRAIARAYGVNLASLQAIPSYVYERMPMTTDRWSLLRLVAVLRGE